MPDSVSTLSNEFLRFFTAAFSELLIRYLLFAGVAYLVFYVFWRTYFQARKVQATFPDRKDYFREIGYSLLTAAIFALVGWLAFASFNRPYTQWYFRLDDHSGWYFAFSVVAMIVVHDAYFYWTHRLMHWRPLYPVMHRVHHYSTNPSPWAAYSFHPLEAVVEASIVLVIAVAIPAHPLALAMFLVWMTAFNVLGHLGYELYPKWLTGSRWGRWLNTSTNHNQHHKYFRGNYALYFRWWDEWMGTTHSRYESEIEALQARPYIDPAQRRAWMDGARKMWMAAPFLAFGVGLVVLENAWIALIAFHGSMIAALVIHRDRWNPRTLWQGFRWPYLPIIALTVLLFGFALTAFAQQYVGYGADLRERLASIHLTGTGMVLLAIYLCIVNPILEEAFWRGLFMTDLRRLTLSDFAYGGFHFFVMIPFMPSSYAAVGSLFLVGLGYLWRQIALRRRGLALPVAWHGLGDCAMVYTILSLLATG